jgi:HK97 gp10 family phage protein
MIETTITGIDDIIKILEDVTPKHANKLIRNTMRGVAVEGQKKIRENLYASVKKREGTLGKSLKVRARRTSDKNKVNFAVYFDTGKGVKNDGFYWRFLEHGTKNIPNARNFARKARIQLQAELNNVIVGQFAKKLESAITRELKKQAASR